MQPAHSGIMLSWMVLFHLTFSTQCSHPHFMRERINGWNICSPLTWRRPLCSRYQLVPRMPQPPGDRTIHETHPSGVCPASLGWISAVSLTRINESQGSEDHWRATSDHTEHMASWYPAPLQKVEVTQQPGQEFSSNQDWVMIMSP